MKENNKKSYKGSVLKKMGKRRTTKKSSPKKRSSKTTINLNRKMLYGGMDYGSVGRDATENLALEYFNRAKMYHKGVNGVIHDNAEALRLYDLAIDLGLPTNFHNEAIQLRRELLQADGRSVAPRFAPSPPNAFWNQDPSGRAIRRDDETVQFQLEFTPEQLGEMYGQDMLAKMEAGEILTQDDLKVDTFEHLRQLGQQLYPTAAEAAKDMADMSAEEREALLVQIEEQLSPENRAEAEVALEAEYAARAKKEKFDKIMLRRKKKKGKGKDSEGDKKMSAEEMEQAKANALAAEAALLAELALENNPPESKDKGKRKSAKKKKR